MSTPAHWDAMPLPPHQAPPASKSSLPSYPSTFGQETPGSSVYQSLPLHPIPSAPPPRPTPLHPKVTSFQPVPSEPAPTPTFSQAPPPSPCPAPEPPDFTDEDLRLALTPLFPEAASFHPSPASVDAQLEPMLRATIRRALAEYSPGPRPFHPPGFLDRIRWRMHALFTSRTYEEIFFEKTHRYQVEEVFLVDSASLSLVSYASTNPGRHSSTRRVERTLHRLISQLTGEGGDLKTHLRLPDGRNATVRNGASITIIALVRGIPSEMAVADLAYVLDTIEQRFRDQLAATGTPLLHTLQPYLEDCLLIQSPANAA